MNQQDIPAVSASNRFEALTSASLNREEKADVIRLALSVLASRHRAGSTLGSPNDIRDFLRLRLGERRNEVFGVLYLDNRHRVLKLEEVFQGTIDGASVYSRVVVQRALEVNAAAVVFFHNHPSGVAEPSGADERLTRRLREALALVDIRVLDHFIITAGESLSFAEKGLM